MAILFAYRNYSPIKKTMKMISLRSSEGNENKTNEFDYIQKTMSQTLEEDRKIHLMLEEQKPIIRDNLIQRLIKRKFNMQQESYVSTISSFGINFPFNSFVVAVFEFDSQQIISAGYSEEKWTFCKLEIIEYLIKAFSSNDMQTYVTEIEGNISLLINIPNNTNNQIGKIKLLSNKALLFIGDLIEAQCMVGIGSIYDSISGINKSYKEAMKSLDYRIFKEYGPVIFCDDMVEFDQSYSFSIKTEQQLANYIKAGEFENAMQSIEFIFKENIENRKLSPDTLKLLFYEIVGTIVKVIVNDMKLDYSTVFSQGFNPSTCLADCSTTEDIKLKFYNILNTLCAYINNNKKSHNTILTSNMIEYIKKEYHNPELCLQSIASEFSITVPYLSRFFKEQTGCNLNKYINDMRIEEAKKLLKTNNITISEIAKNVGFNSDSSFIRVFKKVCGVTPSSFKQNEIN